MPLGDYKKYIIRGRAPRLSVHYSARDRYILSGYEDQMKATLHTLCTLPFLFAIASLAFGSAEPQNFPTSAGSVKITPLNHASTLIEAGGKVIYLDPAKPVKFSAMPKADLILITDIHGDHMDPDSIKEISKPETEIFAPPAVVQTVTAATPIAN